jgi:hypothetical protein
MGQCPIKGVLLERLKGFMASEANSVQNRPDDLIRDTHNKKKHHIHVANTCEFK